ncbi:MAG: hypothetical protein AB1749_12340 [Pseudomonadota bacterium]
MLAEDVLIDAIIETRQQIDFLWQFFMTVQIAVFALIVLYDEAVEKLSLAARALAIFAIALFDYINGNALRQTYRLLDSMMDQYRVLYGQVDRFQPQFYEQFVMASFADRPGIVLVTHGLALSVVAIALVVNRLMHRGRR